MEQELKRIDIHQDYILWQMVRILQDQLGTICSYMQKITPWSDEYQAAYNKYRDLDKGLIEFEDLLQKCLEVKKDS